MARSLAASAVIAGLSGFFRMQWDADEMISSFLLSAAVILVVNYFITGPLDDPNNNLLATLPIAKQYAMAKIYAPSKLNTSVFVALATAVLVVEAGLPSGTFSTADAALDAGRDVLAVPGSIFSPESRGSNRLIRQGATMVNDIADLAMSLGLTAGAQGATPEEADDAVRALRADPMRPDDLARALGIDVVEAARTLGSLEARGLITRYSDGRYGMA